MTLQGWPYIHDPREDRIRLMLLISLLMHASGIGALFIYPLLIKPKSIKVPVLEIVQLEKPKIRLRRQKTIHKETEKPKPKKEAPKFTDKPKAITPVKKMPREVKKEPDTSKIQKVVKEVVEEMVPRMVMSELSDPRLRFWGKRVKKIIQTRWNPPGGISILGEPEVAVLFTVVRSGQIKNIRIGQSSGNTDLDGFAVNTVERVGNVPPIPPNNRDKDEFIIRYIFPYSGE